MYAVSGLYTAKRKRSTPLLISYQLETVMTARVGAADWDPMLEGHDKDIRATGWKETSSLRPGIPFPWIACPLLASEREFCTETASQAISRPSETEMCRHGVNQKK